LRDALIKHDCSLDAYVPMTHHVHVLTLGKVTGAMSQWMQSVGRRYVRDINATYQRSGTVFEGRFKSSLVDSERYLLTCMRYIELNPVRAGLVTQPGEYRWSSYRHHVGERILDWLAEPEEDRRLAADAERRAGLSRPVQSAVGVI
jgi:putative transposase